MTTPVDTSKQISSKVMESLRKELSTLVGRDILILSDQFENYPLYCKVVLVHENILSIDRGGADGKINELDNDQDIIVQFDYKGQRLSIRAKLYRTMGGRCNIEISDMIVPLNRRMFKRYKQPFQVRCAILPQMHIDAAKISQLRWLQTESENISGGGLLLRLPSQLNNKTYLLLNIDVDGLDFPNLVIGHVRYIESKENFQYHVGVQFIINEQKEKHFPVLTLKKIPPRAFEYTGKKRNKFDKLLSESIPDKQE